VTRGGKWVAKVSRAGGCRKGRGKVQRASDSVRLWSETESETAERWRERDNRMIQRSTEPFRDCDFEGRHRQSPRHLRV
jgi:hypothetical protein